MHTHARAQFPHIHANVSLSNIHRISPPRTPRYGDGGRDPVWGAGCRAGGLPGLGHAGAAGMAMVRGSVRRPSVDSDGDGAVSVGRDTQVPVLRWSLRWRDEGPEENGEDEQDLTCWW